MSELTERFGNQRRCIRPEHLHDEILGIDVFNKGKLRLSNWNGRDKLPLAALSDEVITYIQSQVGGSGDVADAVNEYGSGSIAASANSNLINTTASGWKLRGIYVYGPEDATITVTFTPSGGTAKTMSFELYGVSREKSFPFPNPIPLQNTSAFTVNVSNTGDETATFNVIAFGEAV